MIKPVFVLYDEGADLYSDPLVFESKKFAIGAYRRQVRDMYAAGNVTFDQLQDNKFVYVADFDTDTGHFVNVSGSARVVVDSDKLLEEVKEDEIQ